MVMLYYSECFTYSFQHYYYLVIGGVKNCVPKLRTTITVYICILAERKTQNINTEIVGSAYTCITIITL